MGKRGKQMKRATEAQMLKMFLGDATFQEIARIFQVSPVTVGRVAQRNEWEAKRKARDEALAKRIINLDAYERAKDIKVLGGLQSVLLQEIKLELDQKKGSQLSPKDRLDMVLRMMELRRKLCGENPDAPGGGGTGEGDIHIHGGQVVISKIVSELSPEKLAEEEARMRALLDGGQEEDEADGSETDDEDPEASGDDPGGGESAA